MSVGIVAPPVASVSVAAASTPAVVINELYYNPADDNPTSEFVEFRNTTASTIDLLDWCIGGIGACFTVSVPLPPGGSFALYGSAYPGALSNSGERIVLRDPSGAVVDTVEYDDHDEWPSSADGDGNSLQRINDGIGSHPGNWIAAPPTPGAGTPFLSPTLPTFTNVDHPVGPAAGMPITITADLDGADSATLYYRIGFGGEVAVSATVVDGTSSATIPGQAAGSLVRYRWTATSVGLTGTWPRQGDTANYRGTMVATDHGTPLPVFELFMPPEDFKIMASDISLGGDDGYPVVLAFKGQVFDNARIRVKGQTSRYWPKKKFKVILPGGYEIDDALFPEAIDEFALHSGWSDRSLIRETLAAEFMTAAGSPVPEAFPVRLQLNGGFYGLYTYSEQPDGTWRDRYGFDESEVYEVGPDNLFGAMDIADVGRPQNALRARYDKETFEYLDDDRLRELIGVVNTWSATEQREWIYNNMNVSSVVNALAASMVMQHQDWGLKNYRVIIDQHDRISIAQTDFDMSFGHRLNLTDGAFDTFIGVGGAFEHPGTPLFLRFFLDPELSALVRQRVRTIAEEILDPATMAARVDQLAALVRSDALLDRWAWGTYGGTADPTVEANKIVDNFVVPQHARLLGTMVNQGRVSATTTPAIPAVVIETVSYQDAQWVVLRNASGDSVDISGFAIPEVDAVVAGGTVLLPGRAAVLVHEDAGVLRDAFPGLLIAGYFDGDFAEAEDGFALVNRGGAAVDRRRQLAPETATEITGQPDRSALVSIVATEPLAPGFLASGVCDADDATTSTVNHERSWQTRSNLALVAFDEAGSTCIVNSAATHVVADVQGYFADGAVDDVPDVRLADTRTTGRLSAGTVILVSGGRANHSAFVNLTAVNPSGPGFISVVPCSHVAGTAPATSNLNFNGAGEVIAGLSVIDLDGTGGFCVYTLVDVDLVVDLQGYLGDAAWDDIADVRAFDSRTSGRIPAGGVVSIAGRPNTTAMVSLIATEVTGPGFLGVVPCSGADPGTSNVNFDVPFMTARGVAAVRFDESGTACVRSNVAGGHVVADIQGYFSGGAFDDVTDTRTLDTRFR
jgi:hypothetical protein